MESLPMKSTLAEKGNAAAGEPMSARQHPQRRHWLTQAATRFRLRLVLFVAFTVISALPVAVLAIWVERSAVDKEISAVSEKHLLLAKNLTGALSRYVQDVTMSFRVGAAAVAAGQSVEGLTDLLEGLNFRRFAIIDKSGQVIETLGEGDGDIPFQASIDTLRQQAQAAAGEVTFSDLLHDNADQPAFAVLQALSGGQFAVGVLAPDYLIEVQQSIAFGERGHSMIVDATGRVVAHPNPEWQRISKDASKLSVVGKMMRGATGVAQFYSPPMQADMIAGHTSVPGVGWGVMVPQPMNELLDRAGDVQRLALAITAFGIILAGAISWWLAKFIARPIEAEMEERRVAEREVRDLNETLEQRVVRRTEELRRAQDELLKKQRLAVIGQTIGTVSHELRNPLAAVRNSLFSISDVAKEANVDLQRPLGRMERSVKRCEHIISDLLDYTRIRELDREPVSFDAWLDEVLDEQPKPDGIAILREFDAGNASVPLDKDRFRRVVINLYDNACQAMAEDQTERSADHRLSIRSAVVGGEVQLRFVDDGPGMPADVIDRIFEPLFTTKTNGIGLGLPTVKQIVEHHGGRIQFESTVGYGTCALVSLPLLSNLEAAA